VNPAELLPLPPVTFHLLLSLIDGERHGYAIIQDVEARTGGAPSWRAISLSKVHLAMPQIRI
jgi:DNA-binding PadR family transcriptional regulator